MNLNDVSEWTIFIDDVQGELGMKKLEDIGGREIDVLAKEEIMPKIKDLEQQLAEARSVIEFYADTDRWHWGSESGQSVVNDCEKLTDKGFVGGKRAREFLAKDMK